MDIQRYHEQRQKRAEEAPKYRQLCMSCMQPAFSCYCSHVQKFDAQINFVILIHHVEVRRRIATGRMSSLVLENSRLIMGQDYTQNQEVNQILNDPNNHCVILYPGIRSKNLSPMTQGERAELFPKGKKLTIFVSECFKSRV